jgi:hypothetical protein
VASVNGATKLILNREFGTAPLTPLDCCRRRRVALKLTRELFVISISFRTFSFPSASLSKSLKLFPSVSLC